MDANYILKIDMRQFLETASQADCESLLREVKDYGDRFNTISRTLFAKIKDLQEKAAKDKFPDIKVGDKVVVEYTQRNWYNRAEEAKETEPLFFYDISQFSQESTYMRSGPYVNLAIPRKDGSMGRRYKSIHAKDVTKITKVE